MHSGGRWSLNRPRASAAVHKSVVILRDGVGEAFLVKDGKLIHRSPMTALTRQFNSSPTGC